MVKLRAKRDWPIAPDMGVAVLLQTFAVAGAVETIVQRTIEAPGPTRRIIDFDDTWVVGRMVWQGLAGNAYRLAGLKAGMQQWTGRTLDLPWAYPPPYDVLAAGFGLLPAASSYALFVALTGAAYFSVLRALAGRDFAMVMIVATPFIYLDVIAGQNGMMTSALAGATVLAALSGRSAASGVALGALVLKPHLAFGLGFSLLVQRRWRLILWATGVAAGLCAVATLAFGPGIWAAFAGGLDEIGRELYEARRPLWRFLSVYAGLRALGLPAGAALAGQGVAALVALGLTAWAVLRLAPRPAAGMALLCTLAVSPYAYDYDLTLIGPAAALLLPDLRRRSGWLLHLRLVAYVWAAAMLAWWKVPLPWADPSAPNGLRFAALGGMLLWLIIWQVAVVLARPCRTEAAE